MTRKRRRRSREIDPSPKTGLLTWILFLGAVATSGLLITGSVVNLYLFSQNHQPEAPPTLVGTTLPVADAAIVSLAVFIGLCATGQFRLVLALLFGKEPAK